MVGRKGIAVPAVIAGVAVTALASIGIAAEASFPRLIAQNQTALLSYDDKVAAFDAETAVLSLQWGVPGHHWRGPDAVPTARSYPGSKCRSGAGESAADSPISCIIRTTVARIPPFRGGFAGLREAPGVLNNGI